MICHAAITQVTSSQFSYKNPLNNFNTGHCIKKKNTTSWIIDQWNTDNARNPTELHTDQDLSAVPVLCVLSPQSKLNTTFHPKRSGSHAKASQHPLIQQSLWKQTYCEHINSIPPPTLSNIHVDVDPVTGAWHCIVYSVLFTLVFICHASAPM